MESLQSRVVPSTSEGCSHWGRLYPDPHGPEAYQVPLEGYPPVRVSYVLVLSFLGLSTGVWYGWLAPRAGVVDRTLGRLATAGILLLAGRMVVQGVRGRGVGQPRLVIEKEPLVLGQRFWVRYEQPLRLGGYVNHVRLALRCFERTWLPGPDAPQRHEQQVWSQEQVLFSQQRFPWGTELNKTVWFQIPFEAMHTFHAPSNQVIWQLELEVDLVGWGSYAEQFELLVAPGKVHASSLDPK